MNPRFDNTPKVKVAVRSKTVSDISLLISGVLVIVSGLVLLINGAPSGI